MSQPVTCTPIPTLRPKTLPAGSHWVEVHTPQQTIGFVLRRSHRKTIGLTVNTKGLYVTAPFRTNDYQLSKAVRDKAPWILQKLREHQERQKEAAQAASQWKNQGRIPYLGRPITLQLGQTTSSQFVGNPFAPQSNAALSLALPSQSDAQSIENKASLWLKKQAKTYFRQQLTRFEEKIGLQASRLALSNAKTRWGSCNSKGVIRLNWRLIHYPPHLIDYVIAHETAHLRHLNHSKGFWAEVERLYPNYHAARDALKPFSPSTMPLLSSLR